MKSADFMNFLNLIPRRQPYTPLFPATPYLPFFSPLSSSLLKKLYFWLFWLSVYLETLFTIEYKTIEILKKEKHNFTWVETRAKINNHIPKRSLQSYVKFLCSVLVVIYHRKCDIYFFQTGLFNLCSEVYSYPLYCEI